MFNLTVSIEKLVYQTSAELEAFSMPWNWWGLLDLIGYVQFIQQLNQIKF
jgi:hypothetical protein